MPDLPTDPKWQLVKDIVDLHDAIKRGEDVPEIHT